MGGVWTAAIGQIQHDGRNSVAIVRWVCGLLLALLPGIVHAQKALDWGEFQDLYLQSDDYTADELTFLTELHDNPMNLNAATREDLLQIPFLNVAQVDSILAYRQRYKRFLDIGELSLVRNIDFSERAILGLFVYCADTLRAATARQRLFSQGEHRFVVDVGFPMYRREGNKSKTSAELAARPNAVYWGNGLSGKFRYQYQWQQSVAYGFSGKKDAGEPFFMYGNYPFDSYSFYFFYRLPNERADLSLGDFKLHAGEGLLLGNTFISSISTQLDFNGSKTAGFSISKSPSAKSFRGAVATVRFKRGRLSAWASYRRRDANLKDGKVTSFKTDDLHRTALERSKKRNVAELSGGAMYVWEQHWWTMGLAGVYTRYNREVQPRQADYSRYYFRGYQKSGVSTFFEMQRDRAHVHGELASDDRGNAAVQLNSLAVLGARLHLLTAYRRYSPRFVSLHGDVTHASSRVANEEGLTLGMKLPYGRFSARASIDLFRFMGPTYTAAQPSKGFETEVLLGWTPSNSVGYFARYRAKLSQRNVPGDKSMLYNKIKHRLRLYANHAWGRVKLSSAIEGVTVVSQIKPVKWGGAVYGRASVQGRQGNFGAILSLFFTDDYDTSCSFYELSLPYSYRSLRLYDHGCHASFKYQREVSKRWSVAGIYSGTFYFNKESISSGTQLISSPCQNDVRLQISIRL